MTWSLSWNANFQQSDLDPKRSIVYTSANVDSYIYITSFNLTGNFLINLKSKLLICIL